MKIEFDLRQNLFPVNARLFPVNARLLLLVNARLSPVGALCKRAMGEGRGWKPRLRSVNLLLVGALCKRAMGEGRGWKPRLRSVSALLLLLVGALLLLLVGALCKRAIGEGRGFKPRLRSLVCISILMLFFIACADRNTPQAVSEDFIYNYYQRADQGAALVLTDLLAAEKLHNEIARVQGVRMPGQLVDEMPKIEYKQLARQDTSEDQVLFNYELRIKPRGMAETTRNVVLNTELINGEWKVVNFDEY